MKNNPRKSPRKPTLVDAKLVEVADPAEKAELDRRCRAALKLLASESEPTPKKKPGRGK